MERTEKEIRANVVHHMREALEALEADTALVALTTAYVDADGAGLFDAGIVYAPLRTIQHDTDDLSRGGSPWRDGPIEALREAIEILDG